jgi:hypothetical protein
LISMTRNSHRSGWISSPLNFEGEWEEEGEFQNHSIVWSSLSGSALNLMNRFESMNEIQIFHITGQKLS